MRFLDEGLLSRLASAAASVGEMSRRAARAALECLAVHRAEPFGEMNESQRGLRARLIAHGRRLSLESGGGQSEVIDVLTEEAAYERWRGMMSVRLLSENNLLMSPEGDVPVPVTLDECIDKAGRGGASGGWELACEYAGRMLRPILGRDSPLQELLFPIDVQRDMERLAADLPSEVFTAHDSIEWAYLLWRRSGGHEGSCAVLEPAVMEFLLDNSLGAWLVSRCARERADGGELRPGAREKLRSAGSEGELRRFFAIPGAPADCLRFVRGDAGFSPASGWFEGWPDDPSGIKILDPLCGAGTFLASIMSMLVPIRMEIENLSAADAVDAVLRQNIRGLEPDRRRAELAALALAVAAWRYPGAGGYRRLPPFNLACSGMSAGLPREEWLDMAGDDHDIRTGMGWLYEEFRDAPELGCLIDPRASDAAGPVRLLSALEKLQDAPGDGGGEDIVTARCLARAASILQDRYHLVITSIPSLPRREQGERLRRFCDEKYSMARGDLATTLLDRCLRMCAGRGVLGLVMSRGWLHGSGFGKFRENMLKRGPWRMAVRLHQESRGDAAGGSGPLMALIMNREDDAPDLSAPLGWGEICALDAARADTSTAMSARLSGGEIVRVSQGGQLANPDTRIVLWGEGGKPDAPRRRRLALRITDDPSRYCRKFWELPTPGDDWKYVGAQLLGAGDPGELSGVVRRGEGDAVRPGVSAACSDDPASWTFHGHPCGSVSGGLRFGMEALHVAAVRILGYRWPAETDPGIGLSGPGLEWALRCGGLTRHSAADGIACIPPVSRAPSCSDRLLDMLASSYGRAWSNDVLAALLKDAGCAGKSVEFWLRKKFFAQHCRLFENLPFIWHIWDGLPDGFAALVNYHRLDRKTLEALVFSYLGDWIRRVRQDESCGERGASERLAAAEVLKRKLELILEGEPPCDIYVRWKQPWEQPIGWSPDINDGVRLNIRPFIKVPGGDAPGVLRRRPNINWEADRGAPSDLDLLGSRPPAGEKSPGLVNDLHLKLAEKRAGAIEPGRWTLRAGRSRR
ncbi:MAG: hypothetical protein LBQ56_01635 [Synergistaceae bacterium]|jgi:hypothetical protein|nr:hypothetical protein [Synergistaceae bacterium]